MTGNWSGRMRRTEGAGTIQERQWRQDSAAAKGRQSQNCRSIREVISGGGGSEFKGAPVGGEQVGY